GLGLVRRRLVAGSLPTGPGGSARNGDVGPPSSRLTTCRKVHEGPVQCGLGSSRGGGPRRPNPWTKTLAIGTWECHLTGGKEPELVQGRLRGLLLLFVPTGRTAVQSTRPSWSPLGGVLDSAPTGDSIVLLGTSTLTEGLSLSTDHHLVVSWIRWQRRKLDRPGRPKRIVRVCWERLAEPSVREVFNSHLRKSFSQIPREAGDIESEWTMFSASIVDAAGSKLWTCKGDRRVFQLQGGSHFSASREGLRQGTTGEENSADSRPSGFRRNNAVFVLVVEHWTSSIPSTGCLRVYGSLPNQSTCALWIWRRHSTVSLVVFCGGCSMVWGPGAFAKGYCSGLCTTEQELGLYCRRFSRRSQGPEGVRFGNHRISSLLFADDVVLMASSGQDLQHVLERFAAECEAAGMRISTSKSEAMVLDRKRVACPLQVGGEVLPQVEEFKYLGVLFTE
ncbi:hypothetical protein L3Q82_017978, partial [Scortum barcoo]